MLKESTMELLKKDAKESLEQEKDLYDESEIVYLPHVLRKINGKIVCISGANTRIITENER